jgi:hypothetical protein
MARRGRRVGVFSPALYLRTSAVRRGVLGNDRFWRFVAAVIFGRQLLRKVLGREPQLLSVERLDPGQSVHIAAIPPPASRRGRRRR